MISKILSMFKSKKSKREEKILEDCGCICFCHKCKEPLNDDSECVDLGEGGLYEYTCSECGEKSKFHFGIAPVPIFIEG